MKHLRFFLCTSKCLLLTEPALHQKGTWHGWALVTSLTALPAGYLAVSRDSHLSSTFTFRVFTVQLTQQHSLVFQIPFSVVSNASSFHQAPHLQQIQVSDWVSLWICEESVNKKKGTVYMRKPKEMVQGKEKLPSSVNPLVKSLDSRNLKGNFNFFLALKWQAGGLGQEWWCSYAELFDRLFGPNSVCFQSLAMWLRSSSHPEEELFLHLWNWDGLRNFFCFGQ